MIETTITKMFGIKYPIICGAMMWICKEKLCAAISEAGGMGNLTAANFETEEQFRSAGSVSSKYGGNKNDFFRLITGITRISLLS